MDTALVEIELRREVDRLRDEVMALRTENTALRTENATLRAWKNTVETHLRAWTDVLHADLTR